MSILDDEENYFAGRSGSGAFLGSDEDVSISPLFAGLDLNALGIDPNLFAEGLDLNTLLPDIIGDADVMNALKAQDPAAYAALLSAGEGYGFAPIGSDNVTGQEFVGPNPADSGDPDKSYKTAETKKFQRQTEGVPVGDPNDPMGTKKLADISGDKTSLPDKLKKLIADATGLGEDTIGELGKYGLLAGIAKLAYDDAEKARKAKLGYIAPGGSAKRAVISPGGSVSYKKAASGGIMSLAGGGSVDEYGRTAQQKQLENLYRQLDAMDAFNTAGATREGAESPWLMNPENRMMAVGVKDDLTGSGPGVILYDPSREESRIVSSGSLGSMFQRGDPTAAYEQSKNILPYFQTAASLGISGPTTQEQERQIVDTLERQGVPALLFMEYGKGTFAPPEYGLGPTVARRREENILLGRKEKPFEYFKDYLNLSPYQGGLPTIYSFAEGGSVNERPVFIDAGVMNEKGPEDYGIGSFAEDMSIGEYEPEQFNSDTFYQAYANDVYAPEGLIANEVVGRAAFEMPETFDPRNLAFQKEKEASTNEARNRFLSEVMSVDQITGDIDPIQSLKNIAAYDPTILRSVPDLREFVKNVQNLSPTGYDARYGFKAPYADKKFTPEDIRSVKTFGPEYQNMFGAISNILENREGDYTTGGIGGGYGGAAGGIASLQPKRKQPFYLGGPTDGMADQIPAHIDNQRPAALSDGEFVIPADVVSHLGNGNSNAGAKRLYEMMDSIREARTGNSKQGKQINPNKFMLG